MHWDYVLLLLVLAILVPWRSIASVRMILDKNTLSSAERLSLYGSTILFQWLIAAAVLWRTAARGLSLAKLGISLGAPERTLAASCVLLLLAAATQFYAKRAISSAQIGEPGTVLRIQQKLMPQTGPEKCTFLAVILSAALCEEVIYRGFAQTVLAKWALGFMPIGIFAAAALFAAGHAYQGKEGLASTFVVALVFGAARWWTGSLLPCTLAHFATDALAGYWLFNSGQGKYTTFIVVQ